MALIYSEGVSIFDIENTSCEIPRHLAIRTLPNRVRLRDCQMPRIVLNLSTFALKFFPSFSLWEWEINIPSALIGSFGQWNSKGSSALCLQGPSHKALVLDGFYLKPETSPKSLNTWIAVSTDSQLLHKSEVSSANWLILNFFLKIWIPCISLLCLILHAKISTTRINR